MDRSDAIDRAMSLLADIESRHATFVAQFDTPATTRAGTIAHVGNGLQLTCFGVPVACHARPILRDGSVAYEYHFTVDTWRCLDDPLVSFYLTRDGHLESPLPEGSRVCDFNNTHVAERVVDLVANALLRSAYFSARTVDPAR